VIDVLAGIRRITFELPMGPGHVHVYLLPNPKGWTLVDTGLGEPEAEQRWRGILAALDRPITQIVITHFHADHVGGAAAAAAVTGARVAQGALDYEQCEGVWGSPDWPERIAAWFLRHGVPQAIAEDLIAIGDAARRLIRFSPRPEAIGEGDRLDDWEILVLPGHADGHVFLLREHVLVVGDHLLPDISPAVGLYPGGLPDPLGAYLTSLERTIALRLDVALPAHGEPIEDPSARARELIEHHRERLRETLGALAGGARTGYEVSLALFGAELPPNERRFAVAESLAHLEHLVQLGRASTREDGGIVTYTAE
jgi:glyoxylase-like metal-dependent hydrolase (beta-lactamase superfamily II)